MATFLNAGGYKNLSATGNISGKPCTMLGVLCATTTAGTLIFYDSATTTTTTPITGTITPAAGSFTPIPASTGNGLYVVVGGTINATVIFA